MNEHKLVTQRSMVRGLDAHCECMDPDYEDGWNGYELLLAATEEEVSEWYDEHIRFHASVR